VVRLRRRTRQTTSRHLTHQPECGVIRLTERLDQGQELTLKRTIEDGALSKTPAPGLSRK